MAIEPAAELGPEHRELAEIAAEDEAEDRPDIAEVLPVDRFGELLDLLPETGLVAVAAEEELAPALRDYWDDVTTSFHDADAHHLYVSPERLEEATRRARLAAPVEHLGRPAPRLPRPGRRHRRPLAARPPSPSWRSWCARATARSSPGRVGARPSAPPTTSIASRPRCWTASPRPHEPGRLVRGREPARGVPLPTAQAARSCPSTGCCAAAAPTARPGRARARGRSPLHRPARRLAGGPRGPRHRALQRASRPRPSAAITRDYLELEFKDGDRVFVPSDQLHKISRYVGADAGDPPLSKLGGKQWEQQKLRARRAAEALAGELINLYAERKRRAGHAFPRDGEWQLEFEARLPLPRDARTSWRPSRPCAPTWRRRGPMDRLICGDVGYGKTEVALRAAFKAAADGKQVMFLVPTTVLAQQHFGTFTERLRDYPFRIEMVSRFRSAKRDPRGAEGLRGGQGRHPDRHPPAALARRAAEGPRPADRGRGAALRREAEGAAAPAAPAGGRALALRHADPPHAADVAGRPARHHRDRDPAGGPPAGEDLRGRVRRGAGASRRIEREVDRGGQAFFLHNRVETIDETAERVRAMCPKARVLVAHGQMDEEQLEKVMLAFLRGEADVLVCTTIVESGLDISQRQHADRRARGRARAWPSSTRSGAAWDARASAPTPTCSTPSAAALSEEAAARLSTLSDYTELGSGFKIAMRDLEIRGAGNLLGDEQSGHVAAVGLRAVRVDARRGRARAGRRLRRRGARAGARGPAGGRLRAGRLRALRGGEDRDPPPGRRARRRSPT